MEPILSKQNENSGRTSKNLMISKSKILCLKRASHGLLTPLKGSHHGGVWERQIRTVRRVLCAILHQQTLDEEGLQTLLCEIESIINDRPITKASNDPNDLEPLTLNHLLLLNTKPFIPPGYFIQKTATPFADGGRYNIWLTFFGRGGQWNICLSYRNVKNGYRRGETLSQEILFSSLIIPPHATPGSWGRSYKPYWTPED